MRCIDLHSHPELGMQETRTAAVLAQKMKALGFSVTEKIGGTGLVAIYRNGVEPTVMVRTELDGLPMEEKTGLPYASRAQTMFDGKSTFVAQSCGHDIQMAAWVGTAQALLAMRSQWKGTLMFIAQPAEEQLKGAKAMLDAGLSAKFGNPDYGFAAHIGSDEPGTVLVRAGVISSNSDSVQITLKGRGGHGSMPSATIDPIVMGAHFVTDVQSVIRRPIAAGNRTGKFPVHHDIRERIAELQHWSFVKMNQRPKLGSEGRGVNVGFWVLLSRECPGSSGEQQRKA